MARRKFTLVLKTREGTPTNWRKEVISRGTAFAVALAHFHDCKPGELYEGETYRYQSPASGWVYVTVGEEVQ